MYYKMAGVLSPPMKPIKFIQTDQDAQKHYTIHTNKNNVFALRVSEKSKTSAVSFRKFNDALFIGKMIETNYLVNKEWPDTTEEGSIILPTPRVDDLMFTHIQEWDFDEIQMWCTSNFLDMIYVDEIIKKKSNHTFSGNIYSFEAPIEFYQARLDLLFNLE